MDPQRAMESLASRQDGVISRQQAVSCGLSNRQIDHHLVSGSLVRLDHCVFVLNSSAESWRRRLRAALLSRPVAYAAGRSAGLLHEFDGFRPGRPEIIVPFAGNARSPLARVIRSRRFDEITTKTVAGFEATSVAETILTLAATNPPATIERLVDSQLAAKKLDVIDFDPIFERMAYARVRGLPSLKRIVKARDHKAYEPPTSVLEHHLYRLLKKKELPEYSRQVPFSFEQRKATVDAYIPEWKLIVEADGRRWHTRQADFERDRERDNAAASAGLVVVRFTYRMLTKERDACLKTLVETGRWRV